ncbi:uncharacterized protein LOC120658828 [Panicum virgatum]|uniref:Uncharacterized protein n=1 Tax=Panicum virgatum TaxID=38727 RepID=A0A8T0VLQ3_PANVG|nr:uncharacterized protein LOC120658828 [Panicum virgatum]KAG2634546.1 hypothetical protein PVAP13_2NG186203 [Panicum virgatum]
MDHRPPLRDVTNQLGGHSGQGLKRSRAQTDAALPDDHSHVLTVLETKRQKAKDRYAKLTVEQKAQRNAKRREAYAMKKNASRSTEMHTLVANSGDTFATPVLAMLPSNNTTSDNGGDFYEKTPEKLKRERDRKSYANMSEDAKKEKISKKNLARNLNNNMPSRNLNYEGNYVVFLVLLLGC